MPVTHNVAKMASKAVVKATGTAVSITKVISPENPVRSDAAAAKGTYVRLMVPNVMATSNPLGRMGHQAADNAVQ